MAANPLSVVVLAAGEGKRMRSETPKVLHSVAGRSMLARVFDTALTLQPEAIYAVYGHHGATVRNACEAFEVTWVSQTEQLGTGHAVAQALPLIPDHHQVLVLCGDVPLIRPQTLQTLVEHAGDAAALLTVNIETPTGYGRILRDDNAQVSGIVEEKDATAAQRLITEVNTGLMCLPANKLRGWLDSLDTSNAQGEYYLTDCIEKAKVENVPVHALACPDPWEVQGVNDRCQLAAVERVCQRRLADALMREQGLCLLDPSRFDLRGSLQVGRDCVIDVDVIIEGEVVLGDRVRIGPFTRIRDSHVASGSKVFGHCEIEESHISGDCCIGPFARLRPQTSLEMGARVGNFVEVKNTHVGERSKINHLSYVGDATLGRGVNIGAGTITCNYDGQRKHSTKIGDGVFIGSNTALVAPITIGEGVTVGAGTTVRNDVAAGSLAVDDRRPRHIEDWQRPDGSTTNTPNNTAPPDRGRQGET
ncbi:MAG: bifunctional UDP-N-acetylglucosamine diphosphorylase/glucosamine-1-phosphate N-acetyltransferase GlmU [Spiribacter sp.]|jgi:bifunctional UDP-N-acetylglucosamine pyrophosphorylase/glucosamine-1-phosphate N-acetyltransferase|nr:bifunctional UDP-N-acetylglucosamine diphosphorylase/glucosamine-1-phosphate N-acetyltransferase GlmU [Spiribacter sp.]MDR9490250.1 bifunctional UDP-N-acetylglucosamine diphosphorylase/glucosamine-1-phosphate N-acetyltransferase GlmU [Spiribacter sp.]